MQYRAKTIKSGKIIECEIYPIWKTKQESSTAKKFVSNQTQKNLNAKNARKKLTRLLNTNFTEQDLCLTLTYKGTPPNAQQALKDIQNYIRRVKSYRKKHSLGEMKYIYVIEYQNEDGRKKKRIHHHIIMNGLDREVAEKLWPFGWANTKRLQPDEFGLEAIARYMVKDPQGKKRWSSSRNLKKPQITQADTKFTKRMAEKLADDFEEAAPLIFSKLFPDCIFNDCEIKRSDFVAGSYIYARLKKDQYQKRDRKEKMKNVSAK